MGYRARALGLVGLLAGLGCGLAGPDSALLFESPRLRIHVLNVAQANVYVVERSGKRLMIDAGNPGDEAEYEARMRAQGIEPGSIDYLLLTHGHGDHAGTAAHFQRVHGVELIGHRGDEPIIAAGGRAEVCPTGLLARVIRWLRRGISYPSFALDHPIEGEGPLDLARFGIEGQVLPWPGHTPGSVVAVFDEHVFVGDLLRGSLLDAERPVTHFFQCDLDENRRQIRALTGQPGLETWYPGHFGPFGVAEVRRYLGDGHLD